MVTPETIAVALGRPSPAQGTAQFDQWAMWIADANRAVERRAERLGINLFSLDAVDVDYVVRQSVVEMVRNPEAVSTVDVRIDDGSVSKRYATSQGRVTILDDWWDLLGLSEASEAFSIRPAYQDDQRYIPVLQRPDQWSW